MVGKKFPLITNLKEKPSCFSKTIQLIEKSFKYDGPQSFIKDFAPLVAPENHQNCYILIDENENVLAHIGVKEKNISVNGKNFLVSLLGGIAVDETQRGKGHFQTLMQDVLAEKRSDSAFFLLWSDLEKLYQKFGFYLCGDQFELSETNGEKNFVKTKYFSLSSQEKKDVHFLYENSFCKTYLTLKRDDEDWKSIEAIESADLYIKKEHEKITSYFFMNKGQDLSGVIYEYADLKDLKKFMQEIRCYGKVWMGAPLLETDNIQFQFFMSPGDTKLLSSFINELTKGQILIRDINIMKQEVYFDFGGEVLALETQDFLRGIFGPGIFEELGVELKPIFLSGLDSI